MNVEGGKSAIEEEKWKVVQSVTAGILCLLKVRFALLDHVAMLGHLPVVSSVFAAKCHLFCYLSISACLCVCVSMYLCVCLSVYGCVCVYLCMYVFMYVFMYVCLYVIFTSTTNYILMYYPLVCFV